MNISKKKQEDLQDVMAMIVKPMGVAKEMLRKDVIAKKKFEMLEAVAMDILAYCVPEVKKGMQAFNEKQKAKAT